MLFKKNIISSYQVIVIDWDANSTRMHPDNTFNIARWMGNDDDSQLFDLISFLKSKHANIFAVIRY